MLFSDLFFLYVFLPAFFALYFFAWGADQNRCGKIPSQIATGDAKERLREAPFYRNLVIIAFSLIFYAWGEPVYILLLLAAVMISFFCAKNRWEPAGIIILLLMLIFFKYGNLIQQTAVSFGLLSAKETIDIHLPIGISFYTFQAISYLADARRGRCEAQKDFYKLLLYLSMFPQLIAGPIVRYTDVEVNINERSTKESDIAVGLERFIIGLSKKVILADSLSAIVSQTLGGDLTNLSTGLAWLGLIAFSLQIYFDFSGYSDMAIGMGRCMGFTFPENFIKPYLCTSVTDFWRRWHMTLGTFFRDYVYIPLGGNRTSWWKRIRNILIVWMLTGFWHGASWNYLIWGLYFGLWLLLEKATIFRKDKNEKTGVFGFVWRCVAVVAAVVGWGIFYFEDFGAMRQFFALLFGGNIVSGDMMLWSLLSQNIILLAASVFCCLMPREKVVDRFYEPLRIAATVAMLVVSTLLLVGATNHPFLYTRF